MSENTQKIDLIYDLLKDVDKKNDEQNERLAKLEVHVEHNSDSLDHHIKRTDLLEESLNKTKAGVSKKIKELEKPRETVKTVGTFLKWFFSIAGVIGTAVLAYMRIYKL